MKNVVELQKQFIAADNEALLDTDVVSAYTGLSSSFFANRAWKNEEPKYIKLFHKRLYKKADILEWIDKNNKNKNTLKGN